MEIVSTVSSKVQEYQDLMPGAVFMRHSDTEDPRSFYDGRAFVKMSKARAYDLTDRRKYWEVPPAQLVKRVYLTVS